MAEKNNRTFPIDSLLNTELRLEPNGDRNERGKHRRPVRPGEPARQDPAHTESLIQRLIDVIKDC